VERLHIDWTRCDRRGSCVELLAEDPWGYPLARDGSREPPVPDGLARHARRAVSRCPRLALRLVAIDGVG
jgi:ferredoxin